MSTLRFKRFSKLHVLKDIGRHGEDAHDAESEQGFDKSNSKTVSWNRCGRRTLLHERPPSVGCDFI